MKTKMDELARGFSLLSETPRLAILQSLGKKPKNIPGLCKDLGLTQWTVLHHLGILRAWPLVARKRQGQTVIYSVDRAAMKALSSGLAGLMPR